jgi:hypothetical protein
MIGSGNQNPVIPAKKYWFKKGQSGNPGGTATGARKKLTGNFLNTLAEHFAEHGKVAIERLYQEDIRAYVGAIVKLCPRELEVAQAFEGTENEEMKFILGLAKKYMQVRRARTLDAQNATEGCVENTP